MTEVDTSIYKNTAPPPNLLQTYGQAVGIQNAQQQNRLLQQQQDLRAGMGDAFRQAVDPTTGKVDTNRLQAIVSQDPRTAWNTGDVVQQGQANDQATANAQIAKLNNVQAHIQAASGYIAANLGNPQLGVSDQYETIVKGINDMATHGASLMTPQERDQMIASVPKGDPLAQKQFVLNAANQNFAAQKQIQPLIDQAAGTAITTNDGQVIRGGTQQSALRGGAINVPPQQGVQTQTGPGENASLVTVTLENGQKVMVPRSMLPGASGIAPPAAAAPGGNRLAAPPVVPVRPGGVLSTLDPATASGPMGQQPPSTTNPGYNLLRAAIADNYASPNAPRVVAGGGPTPPNASSATLQMPPDTLPSAPGGVSPGANGPILASAPPGVIEAATATATASANQGSALMSRADTVPTNKANYGNMLSDLSKLDTMGPGTEREAAINGVVQKLTGYGITMDKSQVAGAESFAKIANMIAAQQLGSLGPTDARQSLAMGANPHLDLSKLGNTQIIHMLQGNEDAINAKAQAWQKWIAPKAQGGQGNSTATYQQFSTDFNHNFDPRVFQQQYMSAPEIADLRKSMTGPGEAQKFKSNYIYAKDQGWIK